MSDRVPADFLNDPNRNGRSLSLAGDALEATFREHHHMAKGHGPVWRGVRLFGHKQPPHHRDREADLEAFSVLGNQIHLAAMSPRSWQWKRVALMGRKVDAEDHERFATVFVDSVEDAIELYDLWLDKNLREHYVEAEVRRMQEEARALARSLTAEANALPENSDERAAKVKEYVDRMEALYALVPVAAFHRWRNDPNLLVSVVATDGQSLVRKGGITKHATRNHFHFTVTSVGAGRLKLRNVVKDFVALPDGDARMIPATPTVPAGEESTSLTIRLDAEVPHGAYDAWIDLIADGNPDPVAALSIPCVVPEPEE